jgi:hypothetical protein
MVPWVEDAAGAERAVAAAKAELASLRAELEKSKNEADAAKAELDACKKRNVELEKEKAALVEVAGEAIENERKRSDAELAALKGAGDSAAQVAVQRAADNHSAVIARLSAEIDRLGAENAALHSANETLSKTTGNPRIAADLAAISKALVEGTATPATAPLATLIERIRSLRGNTAAFNKNMCILSQYVNYFMKLLFKYNTEDYQVFSKAVDGIKDRATGRTYLEVIEKLDVFLRYFNRGYEQQGDPPPSDAQAREISAHYNPAPSVKELLRQKLGGPGSPLTAIGAVRQLDGNDYFALFVVASQKYLATADGLECTIPEAILEPMSLGVRAAAPGAARDLGAARAAAAQRPSFESSSMGSALAAAPGRAAAAPAAAAPAAPAPANENDDEASFARIRQLAAARAASPVPQRTGVKGSPGNPWTTPDASAALKTLQTVLKVQKGTGKPPAGSPSDAKQYIRENNRPNQTLLDAYCAYGEHDRVICSKYATVKSELQQSSRF